MKHEYEAKFPDIDVAALQTKLAGLGATQTFPRTRLTRKIFENDALDSGQWIRLRDEGTRSTLTLRHSIADILRGLGLRKVRCQENYH